MMKFENIKDALFDLTYEDYYQASKTEFKEETSSSENKLSPYPLYSIGNVLFLLEKMLRLLFILINPYLFFGFTVYFLVYGFHSNSYGLSILFVYFSLVFGFFESFLMAKRSPITKQDSFLSFGATLLPGFYFLKSNENKKLIEKCPIINDPLTIEGYIPDKSSSTLLPPTPWMLCGNLRTLFPFLAFKPKDASYIRRWLRVPMNHRRKNIEGRFESVAFDWLPCKEEFKKNEPKALLILAGLTGGSKEGYILDLVNEAHENGWHCFVMIGRGLSGTPLNSDAFFHGARVSDLLTAAEVIRKVFGKEAKICAAGISMGAIIIANALIKHNLGDYIDGAVSIAGCINTKLNVTFHHSRDLWQSLLALSLKETFCLPLRYWNVLMEIFGDKLPNIIDRICDVYDFDSIMVTGLHGYNSVEEYYADMNPTLMDSKNNYGIIPNKKENIKEGSNFKLIRPFFFLHAIDDPIVHVDTYPKDPQNIQSPYLIDNLFFLITSSGGHIGWPVSYFPWIHRFKYVNTLTLEFCEAIERPVSKLE